MSLDISKVKGSTIFYALFFLGGVVLLCLYKINLPPAGEEVPLLLYLFKEIGMAMIIAICLVFTIERFSRTEHKQAAETLISRIASDIFRGVYSRYIPHDIFREVEKCLLNSNVRRDHYQLAYNLKELNADQVQAIGQANASEHIISELYSSYVLHNLSDSEVVETLYFSIEIPNEKALRSLTTISSFQINDEEMLPVAKQAVVKDNSQDLEYEHKVTLPPGSSVRVSMKGATAKRRIDADVWASRIPSSGVEITVVAPDGCIVECKANHAEKLLKKSASTGLTIWELPFGIFPYQSIIIWWNFQKKA